MPRGQRPLAASLRRPAVVGVTFADIALYFSTEEWHLLDEDQRYLYLDVMLENFELISSLGCCYGAEDVEAPTEHTVSERASQAKDLKVALSSCLSNPSERCGPVLRHIFHLIKHQEAQRSQKLLRCEACAKRFYFSTECQQHQECPVRETPFLRSVDSTSLPKVCNYNVSQKLSACREVGLDISTEAKHLQQETTHIRDRPSEIMTSQVTVQRKKSNTLNECQKAVGCSHAYFQNKCVSAETQCFVCCDCGKYFPRSSCFCYCQRVNTGKRPNECRECGKSFQSTAGLHYHRRVHTGERPYECSECGKPFKIKFHLLRHQTVHTGERPYECHECGKSFKRKFHLLRHQTVHTGERPYECRECGKSFTSSNGLHYHHSIHSGEKPYECRHCRKSFIQKGKLLHHERLHTRERPHKYS